MKKNQDQKLQCRDELDTCGKRGHFPDEGVFWPTVNIKFGHVGWEQDYRSEN